MNRLGDFNDPKACPTTDPVWTLLGARPAGGGLGVRSCAGIARVRVWEVNDG